MESCDIPPPRRNRLAPDWPKMAFRDLVLLSMPLGMRPCVSRHGVGIGGVRYAYGMAMQPSRLRAGGGGVRAGVDVAVDGCYISLC